MGRRAALDVGRCRSPVRALGGGARGRPRDALSRRRPQRRRLPSAEGARHEDPQAAEGCLRSRRNLQSEPHVQILTAAFHSNPMYTLHYSPGSCSLLIHVLLEELVVPFELKKADTKAPDYRAKVNAKGKVPALETPQGVLTECVAILEYLCDRHGNGKLLGKPGDWERARTLERVSTLATEVHPLFNRFFHEDDFSPSKEGQASVKARGTEKLAAWFREQDAGLRRQYWSGDSLDA